MKPSDDCQELILLLLHKEKRESALIDLSKMRESIPDLGVRLWSEPGKLSGDLIT